MNDSSHDYPSRYRSRDLEPDKYKTMQKSCQSLREQYRKVLLHVCVRTRRANVVTAHQSRAALWSSSSNRYAVCSRESEIGLLVRPKRASGPPLTSASMDAVAKIIASINPCTETEVPRCSAPCGGGGGGCGHNELWGGLKPCKAVHHHVSRCVLGQSLEAALQFDHRIRCGLGWLALGSRPCMLIQIRKQTSKAALASAPSPGGAHEHDLYLLRAWQNLDKSTQFITIGFNVAILNYDYDSYSPGNSHT